MRVTAYCQIFEFLHLFSEHIQKQADFLVDWCRMRVTAYCQIFEFLHLLHFCTFSVVIIHENVADLESVLNLGITCG